MEFYDPEHRPIAKIATDAENFLKVKDRPKPYAAPQYIPTLKETKRFAKGILDLRQLAEQKLKKDQKSRIISSQKSPTNEFVVERVINLDDIVITYTLDVGGQNDGQLHITQDHIVKSDYGEEDIITEQDTRINRDGIEIYLAEDYAENGGVHKIYPYGPTRNEVGKTTPRAAQLTEALLNLYMKS